MTTWTDLACRLLDLTVAGVLDWERTEDPIDPGHDDAVRLVDPNRKFPALTDIDVFLRCERELVVISGHLVDRYPLDSFAPYWAAIGAATSQAA